MSYDDYDWDRISDEYSTNPYDLWTGDEDNMATESRTTSPDYCPTCDLPGLDVGYGVYRCGHCGRHFDEEEGFEPLRESPARNRTRPTDDD